MPSPGQQYESVPASDLPDGAEEEGQKLNSFNNTNNKSFSDSAVIRSEEESVPLSDMKPANNQVQNQVRHLINLYLFGCFYF